MQINELYGVSGYDNSATIMTQIPSEKERVPDNLPSDQIRLLPLQFKEFPARHVLYFPLNQAAKAVAEVDRIAFCRL